MIKYCNFLFNKVPRHVDTPNKVEISSLKHLLSFIFYFFNARVSGNIRQHLITQHAYTSVRSTHKRPHLKTAIQMTDADRSTFSAASSILVDWFSASQVDRILFVIEELELLYKIENIDLIENMVRKKNLKTVNEEKLFLYNYACI